jgi:hypothetical protein
LTHVLRHPAREAAINCEEEGPMNRLTTAVVATFLVPPIAASTGVAE